MVADRGKALLRAERRLEIVKIGRDSFRGQPLIFILASRSARAY